MPLILTVLTLSLPTGRVYLSYTYCNLFGTMMCFYVFWFPTFLWLSRTCDVMEFFGIVKIISDHHIICYSYQMYNKNSQNRPWLIGIYHMKLCLKIAIRGDGKSPDQKVIDMQLQAANLVYIFDVIILSVTANKSGRLTVETSFLPLNSQASSYKVHSKEITYKSSKGEQQFLNARHPLDLLYIYTIYYQNISKDIKVIERTSFPL